MNTLNIPEYKVSQFNFQIKDLIENNFNYIRISGEISEIKNASKGQLYITLKDAQSILSCVVWSQKMKNLLFNPELGMQVIATGKITTWSKYKTTYQLDIDKIELEGEGALLKLIEDRKKKLKTKGIFDEKHKKNLPLIPKKIGIITSPNGSVIHDIINKIKERFLIDIDLWPSAVQGTEAEISIIKAIKLKPNQPILYFNLGIILESLGKLKQAEIYTRKAIELKPDYAEAHLNLGCILIDIGKLKEAESLIKKSIDLKSTLAKAYFSLSTLKYSQDNKDWQSKLFSKNILNQTSKEDLIHIYFARANILHKDKKYQEASKYYTLANSLKLELRPSNPEIIIKKSNKLMFEKYKKDFNFKINYEYPESIFIVGMPRSGSTLLESILSMNKNNKDLGEVNILEESYLEWKKIGQKSTLAQLYWKKVNNHKNKFNITTNKWLYNYQYTRIILKLIPNSKIIHCCRNPLDNILSMYRANFAQGNQYSSSLIDSIKVYLHQDEIMSRYKNKYRSKIYDLNYDKLVSNPSKEIKSLLSWLGWKWDDSYLTPHLSKRSVSTASSVQVRSPINSKSIGTWKNYEDLLEAPFAILTKKKNYKNLTPSPNK